MNEYQIALLCGAAIAVLWPISYILCWIGQWAWSWVDDSKLAQKNIIINFLAKRDGYTDRVSSHFPYWNADRSDSADGTWVFVKAILLTSPVPFILVLCVNFYSITLFALLLCVLAWVARFSRRHKKLFDKHIKDKDAHQ